MTGKDVRHLQHDGLTVCVSDFDPVYNVTEVAFIVHGTSPIIFELHEWGDVVLFEPGSYPMGTMGIGVPFFDY